MNEDVRAEATEQRPFQTRVESYHYIPWSEVKRFDVCLANSGIVCHQYHPLSTPETSEQTFIKCTEEILVAARQSG